MNGLEDHAHSELKLTRAAKPRGRRREERQTGGRYGLGGGAVEADRVRSEREIRRARDVEHFSDQLNLAAFAEAERFHQTHVEIEERRLAEAVPSGDVTVDDGAVVVVVRIVLRIEPDDGRE